MKEISVSDLARRHAADEDFLLLDVREPDEIATASLPWATVIAMGEIPERLAELPTDKPIYVLCRSGARSGRVTQFLEQNGYADVANVTGGILAWSKEIDPSVPTY
jgi:sulfur-carrier protein adenylyltransferase/sulfurtransferase